ncbi:MAG: cytochrome c oxidase assembly protein [Verrucomicrobiota bacterium]
MSTHDFLTTAWRWNPALIMVCIVALAAHVLIFGLSRRTGFLAAALGVILLTFQSPIETLADGYLFSAHMFNHLLMVLIVPPLLLLSLPKTLTNRKFAPVLLGWSMGVGAMWIWHIPSLCNASVESAPIRVVQVLSLLTMGALYWQPIFGPGKRLSAPAGMVYLFTACVACTLLGIGITFSPVSVCPVYVHPIDRLGIMPLIQGQWGLTPEKDQQIAGLLMWVPPCLVYLSCILGLMNRWFRQPNDLPASAPGAAPRQTNV